MTDRILGENLQYLMKLHGGLSVSELARQANVPQPTVHHILSGTTKKPRKQCLDSLAKFFSVSVSQLTGALPLAPMIPADLKNSLQITTVPIIEWNMVKSWLQNENTSDKLKEIILDKKANPNAFALIMNDSSMSPMFPEKSVLIFDPGKIPKDRDFVIAILSEDESVIFNRLFIEGSEFFIKKDQEDGNAQLIKLKSTLDKIIATLIEVRLQF